MPCGYAGVGRCWPPTGQRHLVGGEGSPSTVVVSVVMRLVQVVVMDASTDDDKNTTTRLTPAVPACLEAPRDPS